MIIRYDLVINIILPGFRGANIRSDTSRFAREEKKFRLFLFLYYNILYLCKQMETITNMDKPKNRIKEVLEERGIKQTWLAERLGKSFCMVNSYVCNRRQPSLDVLFEIAKILNVDPKELIGGNETK